MRLTPLYRRRLHRLTLLAVRPTVAATLTAHSANNDKADSSTPAAGSTPTGAVTHSEAAVIVDLRLQAGGALPVFPTAHNRMEQLKYGYTHSGNVKIAPGSQQAGFNPPRVGVLDECQGQAFAQFAASGESKVLVAEYPMLDSR